MPEDVRHRRGRHALDDIGRDYDRLAERTGAPVTACRRWLQAWIDTYRDWEPWLVLVGDGELQAVAPLARRRRLGVVEVVMLGHGPSDESRLPVVSRGAAEILADAVVAGLPWGTGWRMRLEQLPAGDPVLTALCRRLPHVRLEAGDGMPLVRVTERDPARYLSKNTRKSLAKIHNRLRERGLSPDVRWTSDPAEVAALLPELARVHRERDLTLGRRPDHSDPRAAAFYREVITRHAVAGQIDLLTLRLDGDLAAFVCGFRDGRTLRSWDNRLAPRWAELSAGRLANTETLLRVVTGDGYDCLDWMRGEEPYKLQSATEVVATSALSAWSSAARRRAGDAGAAGRAGLRRLKRGSPLLSSVVGRARSLR